MVSLPVNELLQRGDKGGFGFLYVRRIRYNLQFLCAVLEIFMWISWYIHLNQTVRIVACAVHRTRLSS